MAKEKSVLVKTVSRQMLDNLSITKHHQGVIAQIDEFAYSSIDEILNKSKQKNKPAFIVIVDEVADPHNLGSIIRTCECAGVDGIIIPKNRSVSVNETVVKVSTGAVFKVEIARVTNINDSIRELKQKDVFVFALEANGESIYQTDLTGNIALVVGSEGFGVGTLTKKLADGVLSLPMLGEINSLNASVSVGIAIYEVLRQRLNKWTKKNC